MLKSNMHHGSVICIGMDLELSGNGVRKDKLSRDFLLKMASPMVLVITFLFAGIPESGCGDSVYRYPLADYTGTAEVVQGSTDGSDGLGTISSFLPHPSLPYGSLYFHGITQSYVELRIGTQYGLDKDWSFTMFIYSKAPHRGTIFDFMYDGPALPTNAKRATKIKVELNDSQIVFTMLGPSGQDFGSDVLGSFITDEEWVPFSVVHDESSGNVEILTLDNEFYKSDDFQDNANKVKLPQPAKVKVGGSFDTIYPFEGSIVCFAIYDTKFSKSSFDSTLDECHPSNWPNIPSVVELPTTQPSTTRASTTPTSTTQSTTSTTSTRATTSTTNHVSTSTTIATQMSSTSVATTSTMLPVTTSTTASSATTTTSSTATTGTSSVTTTITSPPDSFCPGFYGYFMVIAMNTRPSIATTSIASYCASNSQCAQVCLVVSECQSFTYNKLESLCSLFDNIYDTNIEVSMGTHYYKRRDIC